MNFKGKSKNTTIRSGGHVLRSSGRKSSWKKAVITVKEGQKIDLVEGDFS
jgi:large subunit ribosomal protein L23